MELQMVLKTHRFFPVVFALFAFAQTHGAAHDTVSEGNSAALAQAARSMPGGRTLNPSDALAVVLVENQQMVVKVSGKEKVYRISTAKAGEGSKAGSKMTPLGWHKVKSRHGAKAKIGQLFVSRRIIKGSVRSEKEWRFGRNDEVLTRILWLEGLEPGLNKDPKGNFDSYLRHIYIHGTNQEELLGTPASHGCIRMGNRDIAELFDLVEPCRNFYIFIKGQPAPARASTL